MQRVTVYMDGFNLYYGLKSKGWRRYYWLDLRRLAMKLLGRNQRLVAVRYFTTRLSSRVSGQAKWRRQNTYLDLLGVAGNSSGPAHPLRAPSPKEHNLPCVWNDPDDL